MSSINYPLSELIKPAGSIKILVNDVKNKKAAFGN